MKKFLFLVFLLGPLRPAQALVYLSTSPPPGVASVAVPWIMPPTPLTPPPTVSPATPPLLVTVANGLHFGDNGAVLSLRDAINGQWAMGTATALYKKYYFSGDGMIGYIPDVPGANAFYAPGIRFWLGQFLYEQVAAIKTYADATALTAPMLQYLTLGGWITRDFQVPEWRGGWDAGVTIKF
jgi:hypothetical protein